MIPEFFACPGLLVRLCTVGEHACHSRSPGGELLSAPARVRPVLVAMPMRPRHLARIRPQHGENP